MGASAPIRLGGLCALLSAAALLGDRPLLQLLSGLVFLGVLVAVLRATEGLGAAAHIAFAGGLVHFAVAATGLDTDRAAQAAQIGAALLIFVTSVVVWRTNVFPRWSALGAVLGILPLAHGWAPTAAAWSTLGWLVFIGVLMLAAPPVVRVRPAG